VTARDIGSDALVSTGSASRSGELFRIAQTDPLRIYLSVPERYASLMASGRSAAVSFREIDGKIFPAKIVHISGALDPVSHVLLTELQVPKCRRPTAAWHVSGNQIRAADGSTQIAYPQQRRPRPSRRFNGDER
jgi:hypothetical protein